MPRYSFPGYVVFLEDAARQIGRPEAVAAARGIAPLSALGNLCAQAGAADKDHVPGILAKASEFRDQLRAAYDAAELMLADVNHALGLVKEEPPEKPAAREARSTEPKGKKP